MGRNSTLNMFILTLWTQRENEGRPSISKEVDPWTLGRGDHREGNWVDRKPQDRKHEPWTFILRRCQVVRLSRLQNISNFSKAQGLVVTTDLQKRAA